MLSVTLCAGFTVFAQEIGVTGRVTDQSGLPVIGAAIQIEGVLTGATTDLDGKYSIEV